MYKKNFNTKFFTEFICLWSVYYCMYYSRYSEERKESWKKARIFIYIKYIGVYLGGSMIFLPIRWQKMRLVSRDQKLSNIGRMGFLYTCPIVCNIVRVKHPPWELILKRNSTIALYALGWTKLPSSYFSSSFIPIWFFFLPLSSFHLFIFTISLQI